MHSAPCGRWKNGRPTNIMLCHPVWKAHIIFHVLLLSSGLGLAKRSSSIFTISLLSKYNYAPKLIICFNCDKHFFHNMINFTKEWEMGTSCTVKLYAIIMQMQAIKLVVLNSHDSCVDVCFGFYSNATTLRSALCCRIANPSVVCLWRWCTLFSGWSFWQYFFTAVYLGHPLTSVQNFTEIVPGNPSVGGVKHNWNSKINRCWTCRRHIS